MDCFEKFDPINGPVPGYPFFELSEIAFKARELVNSLSRQEIEWIEGVVDDTVSYMKAWYVEILLDHRVLRIIDEQSWELEYLPADSPVTPAAVRRLLENWNPDADEQPYCPTEDDLSEVDALKMGIDCGQTAWPQSDDNYDPVKCAAVLALMYVSNCIDTLECPEEDLGTADEGPIAARLISAANDAIEAARALGVALELASEIAATSESAKELEATLQEHAARFSQERARRAAQKRHSAAKEAKLFVRAEWEAKAGAYQFNKTDFARTYVDLVRNKFKNVKDDPLSVTVKTITEVWLPRSPSAGKPAG